MATKPDFAHWLDEQIHQRGWTQTQMAHQAGITQAALSRVLNRERRASPEMCQGLARALGLAEYVVLLAAGWVKAQPPDGTPAAAELVSLFLTLDGDEQEELLYLTRYKAGRKKKRGR